MGGPWNCGVACTVHKVTDRYFGNAVACRVTNTDNNRHLGDGDEVIVSPVGFPTTISPLIPRFSNSDIFL